MIDISGLKTLAPLEVRNFNQSRSQGHEATYLLSRFPKSEAELIRSVYQDLCRWRLKAGDPEQWCGPEQALEVLKELGPTDFVSRVSSLGRGLQERPPALGRVFHDLRSGGVGNIVAFMDYGFIEIEDARVAVRLAKDHAKMMRGVFEDLEPEQRAYDEARRVHHISSYVQAWEGRRLPSVKGKVELQVTNSFEGFFSERCLETSALDRVLYNLVNNAVRFSQDLKVDLVFFPTSKEVVRICVLNRVSEEQSEWLETNLQHNGIALFQGGLTVGGTGIGLSSCAQIIGQVFGVDETELLVERGYVGATILENEFCAWFHWPTLQLSETEVACLCRP